MNLSQTAQNKLFSLFFISSLLFSLFYNGLNIWFFTLSYFFISFCFAVVFIQRFHTGFQLPINGLLVSAVLLLIWFGLSIFFSPIKYLSIHNFFWVGSIVIVFILFTLHDDKDKIWKIIFPAMLIIITIWALWALLQYYILHTATNASFLNRNTLAALINLLLIPAVGFFLLRDKLTSLYKINRKISIFILFILFLTTFLITSRGGSLSLLLGFSILYFSSKKYIEKNQFHLLLKIIFFSFLLAHISQYFLPNSVEGFADRMVSLNDVSKAGYERFIIWGSLIPLFETMPWYGFGLGSLWLFWAPYRSTEDTTAGFFAHNDYMQITLEAGYPGIILLLLLFFFIARNFVKSLNSDKLNLNTKVEIIALFSTLTTYAAHSIFTYNFYILPLLIIAGLFLARYLQLTSHFSTLNINFSALKKHFKPYTYAFSLGGSIIIFCGFFVSVSLSEYYNNEAKNLMFENRLQKSNAYFLKAQKYYPLLDNSFFSHANLLQYSAAELSKQDKYKNNVEELLTLAHKKLDIAENLHPLRPDTYHIRGIIYKDSQPQKAKAQFEKALKLNPRFLASRIQLATLLYEQGERQLSLSILDGGLRYQYFINRLLIEYMELYADYSRQQGDTNTAQDLEQQIEKLLSKPKKEKDI